MELVPSAWQAARIMEDALATLRMRRIPIEQIFASRLDLVADMLLDLNKQIDASANIAILGNSSPTVCSLSNLSVLLIRDSTGTWQ